jgi:hypothetical protein
MRRDKVQPRQICFQTQSRSGWQAPVFLHMKSAACRTTALIPLHLVSVSFLSISIRRIRQSRSRRIGSLQCKRRPDGDAASDGSRRRACRAFRLGVDRASTRSRAPPAWPLFRPSAHASPFEQILQLPGAGARRRPCRYPSSRRLLRPALQSRPDTTREQGGHVRKVASMVEAHERNSSLVTREPVPFYAILWRAARRKEAPDDGPT